MAISADTLFSCGATVNTRSIGDLISIWENLQKRIEEISLNPAESENSSESLQLSLLEEYLQFQQNMVVSDIVEHPCASTEEKLLKLKFWQRCRRMGNTSLDGFSIIDQIGLSIEV